jgi:hypothetical protein
MRRSIRPDARNVTASSRMANGAVTSWINAARKTGADERCRRFTERDLRVRLDEAASARHLRDQYLICGAADDVLYATQEPDDEQQLDRQRAEPAAIGINSNAAPRPIAAAITIGSFRTRSINTPRAG